MAELMLVRAKRSLEAGAVRAGIPRLISSMRASGAVILAYHNVVPKGSPVTGEASLHLPQSLFASQLDAVSASYEVVTLERTLECHRGVRPVRPSVAITLDDAYQGAMTAGVEELVRRSLPATVFVAPGHLGGGAFWWDAWGAAVNGHLRVAARRHALDVLGGEERAIRAWLEETGTVPGRVPPYALPASEEELRAAASRPGITLGSHTWTHPNLARLDSTRLRRELELPLEWLRSRFDRTIPWLAYPYGEASTAVARAARVAGYRAAVRVTGGALPRLDVDPWMLPRINVAAGLSPAGLVLAIARALLRGAS